MPEGESETVSNAGDSSTVVDVAALMAELQEEVRRSGPRHRSDSAPSSVRVNARAAADRLWPVSADRQLGGRGGLVGAVYRPVKLILRRLLRWYVEPVFADQRAFNDALLRLVDDLYDEVDRLHSEIAALREQARP